MASDLKASKVSAVDEPREGGPWDAALDQLNEWDPTWAATCVKMSTNPWKSGILPRKTVELIGIALNAACTNLNPDGTRRHIQCALYAGGVMPAKEIELLSIAFDASFTHMYAPGTRRHIKNALKAGATMEEIMEVLKLCVVQGAQACNLGVPILAEELECFRRSN